MVYVIKWACNYEQTEATLVCDKFSGNQDEIHKNIFTSLFSVPTTISFSCHEQVCVMKLRFERYFSHHRAT